MTRLTQAVSDMGYQYFDWNVSAADSGGAGTRQKAAANVIQGIQGQSVSVVLQHDTRNSAWRRWRTSSDGARKTGIRSCLWT